MPEPSSICLRMDSSVAEMSSARGSWPSGAHYCIFSSTERSPKERCTTISLPPLPRFATVRFWARATFCGSPSETDTVKVPRALVERLTDAVCYAA